MDSKDEYEEEYVKVVCSVVPGFEKIAMNECKQQCGLQAMKDVRGRITFDIPIHNIPILTNLRSVHHYWVVVGDKEHFYNSKQTKEEIFDVLSKLPNELDWSKALRAWVKFNVYKQLSGNKSGTGINDDAAEKGQIDFAAVVPEKDGDKIRFRCSATRTGEHIFTSVDSARHVGGGVQDLFNWKVDLSNFDVEVVVYIVDDFVSIGIQLTKESQSVRNVTHFGPTTLKANICYCLINLAQVMAGIYLHCLVIQIYIL